MPRKPQHHGVAWLNMHFLEMPVLFQPMQTVTGICAEKRHAILPP